MASLLEHFGEFDHEIGVTLAPQGVINEKSENCLLKLSKTKTFEC